MTDAVYRPASNDARESEGKSYSIFDDASTVFCATSAIVCR